MKTFFIIRDLAAGYCLLRQFLSFSTPLAIFYLRFTKM